jgi:hypothetical protein
MERSRLRVRLAEPQLYADVDTSSAVVPARVGGSLHGGADGSEVIAVSVNGVVVAITRSYVHDGQVSFLAMVPPESLVDGVNSIVFIEVDATGELRLIPSTEPDESD